MQDKKDDVFEEARKNLEKLGETVFGLAKKGKEEGITIYHTGKIKFDIGNLKHKIDERFKLIGVRAKKFCKENKIADEEIVKLCDEIDKLEFLIKNKESEIEKIINERKTAK